MIDFDISSDCSQCTLNCIIKYIPESEIDTLTRNKAEIFYSPGQLIAKQSSFCSKVVFISSGIVKIVKEGKSGRNTIIKLLDENNFIAIPINESQRKFAFSAIALTEVKICEINENIIHDVISASRELKDFLISDYYDDYLFLMNSLFLMNTRNNHGKLAASLLYLNSFNTAELSVFEYVSRKDLAELSSISLESVNKILQELKSDKIIDITNKGIQLKQVSLLEKLRNMG